MLLLLLLFMGRFQCVNCNCTYKSKRFFWENDDSESEAEGDGDANQQRAVRPVGESNAEVSKEVAETHQSVSKEDEHISETMAVEPQAQGTIELQAQGNKTALDILSMRVKDATDHAREESVLASALTRVGVITPGWNGSAWEQEAFKSRPMSEYNDFFCDSKTPETAIGSSKDSCSSEDDEISLRGWLDETSSPEKSKESRRLSTGVAMSADVVRASGTTANAVGSAMQAVSPALTSLSVAGGVVGTASGAYQLHQGLSTPSGLTDPHLVAKGGVTTTVGSTCMILGVGAMWAPGLFLAALGLGMFGLGAATAIDMNVDGLCEKCREGHQGYDGDSEGCDVL